MDPPRVLVTTTTVTTYPSTAASFYASNPTEIDGGEVEGGAASYTADTTQVVYALNVGTQVPPAGTRVVAHAVARTLGVSLRRMIDSQARADGEILRYQSTFVCFTRCLSR